MQSNWNQNPMAVVMDLITNKNNLFTSTVRGFYSLKNVGVNQQSNAATKNTQVTVYPTDTTRFKGEQIATYNRVGFPSFMNSRLGSSTPTVSWGTGTNQTVVDANTTQATLVGIINTIFGLQLSASDYSALTVSMNGMIATISITFSATCFLFNPATKATLTLDQTTQTSAIITVPDLDGLDLPTA